MEKNKIRNFLYGLLLAIFSLGAISKIYNWYYGSRAIITKEIPNQLFKSICVASGQWNIVKEGVPNMLNLCFCTYYLAGYLFVIVGVITIIYLIVRGKNEKANN